VSFRGAVLVVVAFDSARQCPRTHDEAAERRSTQPGRGQEVQHRRKKFFKIPDRTRLMERIMGVDTLCVDDVARAARREIKHWHPLDDVAQQFHRPRAVAVPKWKRVLDFACIIFLLPALIPLALFLLGFIKIVSRGPALIRQKRIGHRCEPFLCWKFRTMHMGADTGIHQRHLENILGSNAPMTKMDAKGDARLIPCGRVLRAMGLDELPQLINVARGEMSIVGPRPCLPYEFEKYLPWQRARFDALPGLTGLWQVSGKNKTTFAEMIRLDISYAQRMSLGTDLRILGRTFGTLATQIMELRSA